MNLKEALKAAIDGKKIKNEKFRGGYYLGWSEVWYCFIDSRCDRVRFIASDFELDWEVIADNQEEFLVGSYIDKCKGSKE